MQSSRSRLGLVAAAGIGLSTIMMAEAFRAENGIDRAIDKPNPAKAEAAKRAKSAISMDKRERRIEKKELGARQFKKQLRIARDQHKQLVAQKAPLEAAQALREDYAQRNPAPLGEPDYYKPEQIA